MGAQVNVASLFDTFNSPANNPTKDFLNLYTNMLGGIGYSKWSITSLYPTSKHYNHEQVEFQKRSAAWLDYCKDTYEALADFRITNSSFIHIANCEKVYYLIDELREMTTHVPYEGQVIDMTEDLKLMLSTCQHNGDLQPLFK